jgi:hypoxanthine phosphoribosyltransferase
MHKDLKKILITKKVIEKRVTELARQISKDYKKSNLILIGVLKGCVCLMSDLSKKLTIKHSIDFLGTSSYGRKTASSGQVRLTKDIDVDVENKDILLIEDIYDTGHTIKFVLDLLLSHKPKSLEILAFLNKPTKHIHKFDIKYIGFDIPNEFVVGYGLDYNEHYRNLECIGVLKDELIESA